MNVSYQCDMEDLSNKSGFDTRQRRTVLHYLCRCCVSLLAFFTLQVQQLSLLQTGNSSRGMHLDNICQLPSLEKNQSARALFIKTNSIHFYLNVTSLCGKCGVSPFFILHEECFSVINGFPPPSLTCKQTPSDYVPEGAQRLKTWESGCFCTELNPF